ncbi:NUDIX hydrolase (plasmid) [Saccharothrix sp. AJ9571]|nr:NUDIX hydrolase [Saccharothrix sp. AJ9571]
MSEMRLTADVCVITDAPPQDREIALIRRRWDPFAGKWALPGGHVDPGESSIAAARRELQEETGLDIPLEQLSKTGSCSTPGRDPRGRYITDVYLAVVTGRPRLNAADDAADAAWFPLHTTLAQPDLLAFDHHSLITEAVAALDAALR